MDVSFKTTVQDNSSQAVWYMLLKNELISSTASSYRAWNSLSLLLSGPVRFCPSSQHKLTIRMMHCMYVYMYAYTVLDALVTVWNTQSTHAFLEKDSWFLSSIPILSNTNRDCWSLGLLEFEDLGMRLNNQLSSPRVTDAQKPPWHGTIIRKYLRRGSGQGLCKNRWGHTLVVGHKWWLYNPVSKTQTAWLGLWKDHGLAKNT